MTRYTKYFQQDHLLRQTRAIIIPYLPTYLPTPHKLQQNAQQKDHQAQRPQARGSRSQRRRRRGPGIRQVAVQGLALLGVVAPQARLELRQRFVGEPRRVLAPQVAALEGVDAVRRAARRHGRVRRVPARPYHVVQVVRDQERYVRGHRVSRRAGQVVVVVRHDGGDGDRVFRARAVTV